MQTGPGMDDMASMKLSAMIGAKQAESPVIGQALDWLNREIDTLSGLLNDARQKFSPVCFSSDAVNPEHPMPSIQGNSDLKNNLEGLASQLAGCNHRLEDIIRSCEL